MDNNAETPGEPNPSGEALDGCTAQVPGGADIAESSPSNESHITYDPPPASRAETGREERALRRMYHQRKAHPWSKKIPWILFPTYGFMRLHDPNHEEHYEQWKERQRRNYDEG